MGVSEIRLKFGAAEGVSTNEERMSAGEVHLKLEAAGGVSANWNE